MGRRGLCPECGSYWDLDAVSRPFEYDDTYPETRMHLDPIIGALKVDTLKRWLRATAINPEGLAVCEVGFGACYTLRYFNERARVVWGVEPVARNLQNAAALGIPSDHLMMENARPRHLTELVDLWVFLDSFEHLPEPAEFMTWVRANTSARSRILVVAPRADSLSNRVLGGWWPHRVPDHPFHWSRQGLVQFFGRYGFRLEQSFFPWKDISLRMVAAHLRHKFGRSDVPILFGRWLSRLRIPFNIGEMGLVFARHEINPL